MVVRPSAESSTSRPSTTPTSLPSAVGSGLVNWPFTVLVLSTLPVLAATSYTCVSPRPSSPTSLRVNTTVSVLPQPGEKYASSTPVMAFVTLPVVRSTTAANASFCIIAGLFAAMDGA